jgi:hypothetical protein
MVVVLSTRMASLLGRFGPTPLTGLAFTCLVLAYAVFLRAGIPPDYPAVMLPATLLVGLAFGLGFSSLSVAATAGVPDAEQGLAASLFQTSFQVGGALVLAIVTAVVDAGGAGRRASAPATLAAYRPALGLITGVAAIGMLVALSGLRRRPVQQGALPYGPTAADLEVGDLANELAAGEIPAGELGDLAGCPALPQAADVADGSSAALAVRRDDDHHGRSARAGTARAPTASGAESSGGRQDRPAPADVPARQVAAQPARTRIAVLPGVRRGPDELLAALLD